MEIKRLLAIWWPILQATAGDLKRSYLHIIVLLRSESTGSDWRVRLGPFLLLLWSAVWLHSLYKLSAIRFVCTVFSCIRRVRSGPEKVLLYDPDPGARLLIYCR